MEIPANITKSHLLQAIAKIDAEGIPPGGASKYYVVESEGKHYPPKLIVAYANIFANGEILDRNRFEGGLDTPCFRLLEKHGFKIIPKPDSPMEQVRIYEIKKDSVENARLLISPDGSSFYWNDLKFTGNAVGDYIFIINRYAGWALFTRIGDMQIATQHNAHSKITTFNSGQQFYSIRDDQSVYNTFVRFTVLEKAEIPEKWKWTKNLHQSEVFILRQSGMKPDTGRLSKVDDLQKLFQEGPAYDLLEECRAFLQQPDAHGLRYEILEALNNKEVINEMKAPEFLHQLAQDKLEELIAFHHPLGESFYRDLLNTTESISGFQNLLDSYNKTSEEHKLLTLIGELVAYCDTSAANKRRYNKYSDFRVLAKSYVRQDDWVRHLIHFKMGDSDPKHISAKAIKNAVTYLLDPIREITMLSENHREMVSRYLLKQPYDKNTFVEHLISFFAPYNIQVANRLNYTRVLMVIMYRFPKVKALWFETIEGLVVCDNTGWLENARANMTTFRRIVLWWDKLPSGTQHVIRKLRETLNEKKRFYIYYTINQQAVYRSRITDLSQEEDYPKKYWYNDGETAWHQKHFSDYKDEKKNGKISQAKIAFLADEVIRLKTPIPVSEFEFYKHYQAPTQNNMQPYTDINMEAEAAEEPVTSETEAEFLPMLEGISFEHELRTILTAIQTKPFVLLAGISGTGKSRLVRKLAYRTCAIRQLQGDTPGNFAMIPVRSNWHDSTELMGYVSRISQFPQYVSTDFLRFVVSAWHVPDVPFFLCLDEMNLAPVEQYFAEYLSVLETRRREGSRIVTDALWSRQKMGSDYIFTSLLTSLGVTEGSVLWDQFFLSGITIPSNLVVMGTVNMDETTHSFSRKVLDRAMTFEMNEVNLAHGLEEVNKDWNYEEPYISSEFVTGDFTGGGQVYGKFEVAPAIIQYLDAINEKLEGTPFKIAYRVRDEFLIYCYQNSFFDDKDQSNWLDRCLDEMTCMKILPRIEGDEHKVADLLESLQEIFGDRYPKARRKLNEMIARLKTGYTSFWS